MTPTQEMFKDRPGFISGMMYAMDLMDAEMEAAGITLPTDAREAVLDAAKTLLDEREKADA